MTSLKVVWLQRVKILNASVLYLGKERIAFGGLGGAAGKIPKCGWDSNIKLGSK
jgi:hypothetical protein